MSRKKFIRCLFRNWLAPSLCLIGFGMILAIIIPFWLWILVAGIGLISYGIWQYLC
ncbi:hypothetical protein [Clostridium cylindrosporum]|uniref:Uncharacterized protein n=1 Tax=Clostridium cylindrosporum DSM 605 TaxID=1121307 RepID=A0A0J8D5P7_CLOCY|nr:hypothetical protein [Clostridium cylindrosporum]KMT21460.1 hypothetical protein CLCY_2c02200 [Clostridium cylindrosporum DSM 605]